MFGLGIAEITVILLVALLVLGPKRLPDAARSLGRSLAEFRRASNDIRNALVLESSPEPGPPLAKPSVPSTPKPPVDASANVIRPSESVGPAAPPGSGSSEGGAEARDTTRSSEDGSAPASSGAPRADRSRE